VRAGAPRRIHTVSRRRRFCRALSGVRSDSRLAARATR
jgi:hypothetical protein